MKDGLIKELIIN